MDNSSLPTQYQSFIHVSQYARWDGRRRRRETWQETVDRYFDFFYFHLLDSHNVDVQADGTLRDLRDSVLGLRAMPSMRCLQMAGKALQRDHAAGYNCSYVQVDDLRAFDEAMYLLMCGSGVGFSVERQFTGKLPMVPRTLNDSREVIEVEDSRLGWAKAYRRLLTCLWSGQVPGWDVSRLRPRGAPLKTTGGQSSGPDPLVDLFRFTIATFRRATGRRLSSLECHDLMCKVGDIVVVGGVRRSAMISLSNPSDARMRDAKSGNWWEHSVHRALSNNSAAYTERPEVGTWLREWLALYESKSGERGVFNRVAATGKASENGRRRVTWDDGEPIDFGTNPCGEIILRSMGFCNLTEAVCRADDTTETLEEKVRQAAVLGTWQSTLTKFRYLRKGWRDNSEEERLLGVSMTGIMDCPLLNHVGVEPDLLRHLKGVAIETNREWSERLGIRQSVAITTVKPSGTVSQLVDSSSGIHAREARMYIRRVRLDKTDPLARFMVSRGFPHEDDVTKPDSTVIFEFPIRAPGHARVQDEVTAMEQLEHWLAIRTHWCEHNPSTTITVREQEWPRVGAWVYDHFDSVGGLAFLPKVDMSTYRQVPYEGVDEARLSELEARMPQVDWADLGRTETGDNTARNRERACVGTSCEL